MPIRSANRLTRIGVFYDGNYFLHVSNYYAYNHARSSRISIAGLHEFIRHQVAEEEGIDVRSSQIVDAHFFRGRIPAQEASQRGNMLFYERVFDDILMWEGVITHYLPMRNNNGKREEKGIDVWFALEAYELTLLKEFDVVVLLTSDSDYVPLVRKLNTTGAKVMLLSWDFEFTDNEGKHIVTRTSQELLEEVTYPIAMHDLIESRVRKNDVITNNLFVHKEERPMRQVSYSTAMPMAMPMAQDAEEGIPSGPIDTEVSEERFDSIVLSLKSGYGFIKYPPNNLFFHLSDLIETEFEDLRIGDQVDFNIGYNDKGEQVAKNVRLLL